MLWDDATDELPSRGLRADDEEEPRVLAAVKQYMQLLEAGQAVSIDRFLLQHAEIAGQLRPSLEGLALVHRAAKPTPLATAKAVTAAAAPDAEFMAKPIGDFQIVSQIGRGGMGIVYEAIQLSLGRRVALKVLPFASALDEVRLQRFRNEAHAAAGLHHTNIVPVYAVGTDRGIQYYAMQLIEGQSLAEVIEHLRTARGKESGKVPATGGRRHAAPASQAGAALSASGCAQPVKPSRLLGASETARILQSTALNPTGTERQRYYQSVVRMIHQAALAIEHAHQYGVIHRDLKPGNLLVDSVGKVWVTDFGLAQIQQSDLQLTRTGDSMGTLRYMSPEQAAGKRVVVDHRTDIYSLGVTLYEILTLEPAIRGEGYRELLDHVIERDPVPPKQLDPALPLDLDTIVRKAIAKEPAQRYATAQALADDLQRWLDDKPIAARPPTIAERLTKWRRRNSGLVTAAIGFLVVALIGLSATTVIVANQQRQTVQALERETEQRRVAEQSFQQARLAVDTFSSLSETELAYRPELQDLRRSFLETSLQFYQNFLAARGDDPALKKELAETSARVEQMVDELRVLEDIAPLMMLAERAVQEELHIDEAAASEILGLLRDFHVSRQSLANTNVGGLHAGNAEMSELVRSFRSAVSQQLDDAQLNRLRQISRQRRVPFTFKSAEVVEALNLTQQQREAINRIIEVTRPGRIVLRGPGRPVGPAERRVPPPVDFVYPFPTPPQRPDGGRGPGPIPAPGLGPGGFGPGPGPLPEIWPGGLRVAAANTLQHILEVLDPQQRQVWNDLVGEPFVGAP